MKIMQVTETTTLDSLMETAYARWEANEAWNTNEFWEQLSEAESVAVFVGNLNYQVCNGGFGQWDGNYYSKGANQLQDILVRIGTPAALTTQRLVESFMDANPDVEMCDCCNNYERASEQERIGNENDDKFYAINDQLLIDTETYLVNLMSKNNK